MAKKLHDLQKSFFRRMVRPTGDTSGDAEIKSLEEGITGHFHVYENAYRLRIQEAITEDFAQSLEAIGPELAHELFDDFFAESFSDSFTLNAIGFVWLDFLARTKIMLPEWFLELANFEWELTLALYRESDSEFVPKEVVLVSGEAAPLETPKVFLAPAVKVIEYQFPVTQIYRAGDTQESGQKSYDTVKNKVAVWRDNDESHFAVLNPFSVEILERFLRGQSLPEVTNDLSRVAAYNLPGDDTNNLARKIQQAFAELSEHGIIALKS